MVTQADGPSWGLADLHEVVDRAMARGAHLLTRGEHLVAQTIRGLSGLEGALYARLTTRTTQVWTTESVDDAESVRVLEALGLLSPLVPWSQRAAALPMRDLKAGCRRLNRPVGGRRDDLLARLHGQTGWTDHRFVRLVHPGLIRRLEQWALLRRHPDRSAFVVARLGVVRWPRYRCTPGVGLHRNRAAWRRWAHREHTMDAVDPAMWLRWLADDEPAPGRLSLRRPLLRRVLGAARDLERAEEPDAAAAIYAAVAHIEPGRTGSLACRHALALEQAGASEQALTVLWNARPLARSGQVLAIERTGRRIARGLKRGWPPSRPLAPLVERRLTLDACGRTGARPAWQTRDGEAVIEAAVIDWLAVHGRRAIHAEGTLWTTLFALLFAQTWFLPVSGALPTPFLTAPLDLGTPAFESRRAEPVQRVFDGIAAGQAADRVRAALETWHGVALAGASWSVEPDDLVAVAQILPPSALVRMMRHLMGNGRRSARGLPDLVVLALGDEQRVWLDRLAQFGIAAEVWHVRPA